MNNKEKFEKFLEEFKQTKLWQDMAATTENSPWHRESSVARHVEMILEEYDKVAHLRTERQQNLTRLCIIFHDTGKPKAAKSKTSESRGTYTSFGGHEAISARIWEDYAAENWNKWKQLKSTFQLKDTDIYLISWVIENHLPHDLDGMEQKVCDQLNSYIFEFGTLADVYFDQIISDQSGRISDAHEKNLAEVFEFIENIKTLTPDPRVDRYMHEMLTLDDDMPLLVVMVGASGSGKSTYSNNLEKQGFKYFSLDASRLAYGAMNGTKGSTSIDRYARAYAYCDKHRGPFRHFADRQFSDLIDAREHIIVDNTNVNYKARENYIKTAKAAGYRVSCALFPITRKTLLERQKSRKDKTIPIVAVMDQYNRISMPWIGSECNFIDVAMHNVDGHDA
jgi:predicted kinase